MGKSDFVPSDNGDFVGSAPGDIPQIAVIMEIGAVMADDIIGDYGSV